jgi:hypothetical protein
MINGGFVRAIEGYAHARGTGWNGPAIVILAKAYIPVARIVNTARSARLYLTKPESYRFCVEAVRLLNIDAGKEDHAVLNLHPTYFLSKGSRS